MCLQQLLCHYLLCWLVQVRIQILKGFLCLQCLVMRQRNIGDEALTLSVPVSPFSMYHIKCPIMNQEHIMGVYTALLYY